MSTIEPSLRAIKISIKLSSGGLSLG